VNRFIAERDLLADEINAVLPQTQCGQCGYPACRPYAEAIAKGEADINQCPPGGAAGIRDLARVLGIEPKPLNPKYGREKLEKTVAVIDEQLCIGCTLCIRACPVDAILGAAKQMHTVIAQECTGCDLCKAPCPVDCITMIPVKQAFAETDVRASERDREKANLARRRYQFRQRRLALEKTERASRLHNKKNELQTAEQAAEKIAAEKAAKKAAILAAVERVRAKRARATTPQGNVPSSDKQAPPSVPPNK
jgi:electron transport complex protein RnfB